jgi:hypothetical protein
MYLSISQMKSINKPMCEFLVRCDVIMSQGIHAMVPPTFKGLSLQVDSDKLNNIQFIHGVKLQIGIQLMHPSMCSSPS